MLQQSTQLNQIIIHKIVLHEVSMLKFYVFLKLYSNFETIHDKYGPNPTNFIMMHCGPVICPHLKQKRVMFKVVYKQ